MDIMEMLSKERLPYVYASHIFSNSRRKDTPTKNEIKISLLVLSHLSNYKMFYNDKDITDSDFFYSEEIRAELEKIPRKIEISRNEFISITESPKKNASREIKNTFEQLRSKKVELPNPFDSGNQKSYEVLSWVSAYKYNDKTGLITVTINEDIIPYLVIFSRYKIIELEVLFKLKSPYAIFVYMLCKLVETKYKSTFEHEVTLDSFKDYLGLTGKYKPINMLKERVLIPLTEEINNSTDLDFDYNLIKTGNKYSDITLKFKHKSSVDIETRKLHEQTKNISPGENNQTSFLSYIKEELLRYGFSVKKAENTINEYGCEPIDSAIEKMRSEVKKGKVINNLAGYLLRCIENYSRIIDSSDIKSKHDEDQLIKDAEHLEVEAKWCEIEKFCSKNESIINSLYSKIDSVTPLLEQKDIDFFEELKLFIDFYQEFQGNNRIIMGVYLKEGSLGLGFSTLESIIDNTVIADPLERLPHIKKSIMEKQRLLEETENKLDCDSIKIDLKELNNLLLSLI